MVTEPARIVLGDVEVTRVQEYAGNGPATPVFLFPDGGAAYWADNAGWLDPDFYNAANGTLRTVLHTWLIRSQGTIILLDTGAGNGKERPYAPAYAHHDTAYLDNLLAAGSEANARAQGTLRLEGKEYVVQDGDVMHIRHSG